MVGCDGPASPVEHAEVVAFGVPVPAPAASDVADATCVDIGAGHRVCYRDEAVIPVERPVPALLLPEDARWRCAGTGSERRCVATLVRPFSCDTDTCVQRFPALPSDGPTECSEVSGVVLCRTRSAPAGVVPGPDAIGWLSGEAPSQEPGETLQIFVDLSPQRPADLPASECHFEHRPMIHRVCRPSEGADGAVGGAGPCDDGLVRAGGVCVPERLPRGECWTTPDCSEGRRCVLSSCVEGG